MDKRLRGRLDGCPIQVDASVSKAWPKLLAAGLRPIRQARIRVGRDRNGATKPNGGPMVYGISLGTIILIVVLILLLT